MNNIITVTNASYGQNISKHETNAVLCADLSEFPNDRTDMEGGTISLAYELDHGSTKGKYALIQNWGTGYTSIDEQLLPSILNPENYQPNNNNVDFKKSFEFAKQKAQTYAEIIDGSANKAQYLCPNCQDDMQHYIQLARFDRHSFDDQWKTIINKQYANIKHHDIAPIEYTGTPVLTGENRNYLPLNMQTKHIEAKLNGKLDARFTLQFVKDAEGERNGILTVPYVKWMDLDTPSVLNKSYTIKGKELECVEKQYFDNNLTAIPVKDYPIIVEMPDILEKIVPSHIYEQMITGTFNIPATADKTLYGNLPVKPKEVLEYIARQETQNGGICWPSKENLVSVKTINREDGTYDIGLYKKPTHIKNQNTYNVFSRKQNTVTGGFEIQCANLDNAIHTFSKMDKKSLDVYLSHKLTTKQSKPALPKPKTAAAPKKTGRKA